MLEARERALVVVDIEIEQCDPRAELIAGVVAGRVDDVPGYERQAFEAPDFACGSEGIARGPTRPVRIKAILVGGVSELGVAPGLEKIEADHALLVIGLEQPQQLHPGVEAGAAENAALDDVAGNVDGKLEQLVSREDLLQSIRTGRGKKLVVEMEIAARSQRRHCASILLLEL